MAHIEKRGPGRWRARYRAPDGGERSRTFERKIDAERWLTSVENSKLTGSYVDPAGGRVTFHTYAEEWRKVQPHRAGTAVNVEQDLRLHVYPTLGKRPLAAVRPTEIQALVTQLASVLAASTLQRVYGRITAVFRAAVRDRLIGSTPCIDIRLPRVASGAITEVLTTEQVLALADAMVDRYRGLVIAGAGLGLRPGELFGLAVDHIDFLKRSVRVDQQVVRNRAGGVLLGPVKTPASYRTVPLPATVAAALAAHLSAWPVDNEFGVVFANRRGGLVQESPFGSVWKTARAKAGVPAWATPHDLRHHYASLLIRAGASVKVVQTRLGHASAKTTLDTYAHLFPDEEDRTRTAVDEAFSPPRDASTKRAAQLE